MIRNLPDPLLSLLQIPMTKSLRCLMMTTRRIPARLIHPDPEMKTRPDPEMKTRPNPEMKTHPNRMIR